MGEKQIVAHLSRVNVDGLVHGVKDALGPVPEQQWHSLLPRTHQLVAREADLGGTPAMLGACDERVELSHGAVAHGDDDFSCDAPRRVRLRVNRQKVLGEGRASEGNLPNDSALTGLRVSQGAFCVRWLGLHRDLARHVTEMAPLVVLKGHALCWQR